MPRLTLRDSRIPTTFDDALAFIDPTDVDDVPIAHNTELVPLDDDVIGVRLHSTIVVEMHRDGTFVLDSGGWRTTTTKDRINRFTPPSVRVWQHDHEWVVADRYGEREFVDGMTVAAR